MKKEPGWIVEISPDGTRTDKSIQFLIWMLILILLMFGYIIYVQNETIVRLNNVIEESIKNKAIQL